MLKKEADKLKQERQLKANKMLKRLDELRLASQFNEVPIEQEQAWYEVCNTWKC